MLRATVASSTRFNQEFKAQSTQTQWYNGTHRTTYLPDNREGKEVLTYDWFLLWVPP